jgi:hypothetical protein
MRLESSKKGDWIMLENVEIRRLYDPRNVEVRRLYGSGIVKARRLYKYNGVKRESRGCMTLEVVEVGR